MYDRLIYQDDTHQWRVTISVFNGVEYFHLRKYILDFDENWVPIKEGVAFPLDLDNVKQLFIAMLEILSLAESRTEIEKHFKELLADIYV